MNKNLFFIEDEVNLTEFPTASLLQEGFTIYCFKSSTQALNMVQIHKPDCILVDLLLPGTNGYDFCQKIKDDSAILFVPIIVVSARNHEFDILNAFNNGADDYVAKPFSAKVLAARINLAIRKNNKNHCYDNFIKVKDLKISPDIFEVKIENKKIPLTSSEFRLLNFFVNRINKVYSRDQLIEAIKGYGVNVNDRCIDIAIGRLRKKLGKYGKYIETIYGMGYRFNDAI